MAATWEVADVFRRHGEAYRRMHHAHLGRVERRVISAITLCRTAALGGHAESCADCGFVRRLRDLRRVEWVVYAKPPFGGPEQVLAYLGRYTHRVAIANSRLVEVTGSDVAFHWKDYRHHGKAKLMVLAADEFIRRFLLHALPDGFHRIRHYGFLANHQQAAKLALRRELLAASPTVDPETKVPLEQKQLTSAFDRCPCCGGPMITFAILLRPPPQPSFRQDTS